MPFLEPTRRIAGRDICGDVGVCMGALAQDVFPGFSGFTTGAFVLTVKGKSTSELACVSVASTAL